MPCIVTLSVTCLLIAAKIEEAISPSVNIMLRLLLEKHNILLSKRDVIDLEEHIIRVLDFQLRNVSPIDFLERFLRLFGLDTANSYRAKQVAILSNDYCKFMQRTSCFLAFRPS